MGLFQMPKVDSVSTGTCSSPLSCIQVKSELPSRAGSGRGPLAHVGMKRMEKEALFPTEGKV